MNTLKPTGSPFLDKLLRNPSKEEPAFDLGKRRQGERLFPWLKNKKAAQLEERARQAEERLEQERKEREQREQEWERQEQKRQYNEWVEKERLRVERLKIEQKKMEQRDQERRRQKEKMNRLKTVSPETLMELRELLRARYELDMEIWNLRHVRRPDRPIVQEKMAKSDALLGRIRAIVNAWNGTESSWTPNEWKQAQEIQTRVLADGKRIWTANPPWNEE